MTVEADRQALQRYRGWYDGSNGRSGWLVVVLCDEFGCLIGRFVGVVANDEIYAGEAKWDVIY